MRYPHKRMKIIFFIKAHVEYSASRIRDFYQVDVKGSAVYVEISGCRLVRVLLEKID